MNTPLILGSSSIWRKQVLQDMGYKFKTMSPDIDEKAIRDEDPKKLTLLISRAKAEALLNRIKESNDEQDKNSIMICSDQVIVCNDIIREKPISEEQCREYLKSYEFYPAVAVVSVVVVNIATGKMVEGTAIATQHFKKLPDQFIDKLIKQGDCLHCAGGFTVEHMSEYTGQLDGEIETIMGLPKTLTTELIQKVQSN